MYTFRPRKNEDSRIEEFLNKQSGGYGDILRYLIEKEIAENGIRDLTLLIPAKRNIDDMIVLKSNANVEKVVSTKIISTEIAEEIQDNKNAEISSEVVVENIENEEVKEIDINKAEEKIIVSLEKETDCHEIESKDYENSNDNEDINDIPSCYFN